MRSILAITGVTLRHAFRSRVVLTIMSLLAIVIVGIPLTVEGDGTVSGHVQIVLNYTLSLSTLLLAVMTIWLGCAAVSVEIRDRQLHLVLTKPLRTVQLWAGKWLGILLLDAILLTFAIVITYSLLLWTTRPAELTADERKELREEILTARRGYQPQPPDIMERARRRLDEGRRSGAINEDIPDREALERIRRQLLLQEHSVSAGEHRRWRFNIGRRPTGERPIFAVYRLEGSLRSQQAIRGRWFAGTPDHPQLVQRIEPATPGGRYSFEIPAEAIDTDGSLVLTYVNIHPSPATVIFPGHDGIEVLVTEGGFEANLLRAGLMIFFQLAFLAALALTAGCLFSLPVAAFVSLWIVFLLQISDYLQTLAVSNGPLGEAAAPSTLTAVRNVLLQTVFRGLHAIVRPLQGPDVLAFLTTGRLVSWGMVTFTFAVRVLLYSSALALVSSFILNRREIGLPQ